MGTVYLLYGNIPKIFLLCIFFNYFFLRLNPYFLEIRLEDTLTQHITKISMVTVSCQGLPSLWQYTKVFIGFVVLVIFS